MQSNGRILFPPCVQNERPVDGHFPRVFPLSDRRGNLKGEKPWGVPPIFPAPYFVKLEMRVTAFELKQNKLPKHLPNVW